MSRIPIPVSSTPILSQLSSDACSRVFRIAVVLVALTSGQLRAAEPDWRVYGELLREYVAPGTKDGVALNLVDYRGLAAEPRFRQVVEQVRRFDVAKLETREARLAFYINAYNILTIALILEHWPVDSIRDIGNFLSGPWDRVVLENADGRLTLDDIEHELIRPLGEPRIHFAVNCASVSCPDLRREPYEASRLDTQLDAQTRDFLSNTGKGFRIENGVARVSRIFDWYEEDFEAFGGVERFVRQYRQDIDFKGLGPNLRYNWQLNGNR